jgi:hypothetical protein
VISHHKRCSGVLQADLSCSIWLDGQNKPAEQQAASREDVIVDTLMNC